MPWRSIRPRGRRVTCPAPAGRHAKSAIGAWPSGSACASPAHGRVSRSTPVHTAARNCTRDEGRPFGLGDQVADPKPPRTAAVKSHGGERRGNAGTIIPAGKVERGASASKRRRSGNTRPRQRLRELLPGLQEAGQTAASGRNRSFALWNDQFDVSGKTVCIAKLGVVRLRAELRFAGKIR
jgi:hypothetical protein